MTAPIGYLVGVTFLALSTLFAVAPLRRPQLLARLSCRFGLVVNELPFIAFWSLLASTSLAFVEGDVDSPGGWIAFALAVLTMVGLIVVAWRGVRGRPQSTMR